jgi:RND superfamily putative drug exporter
VLSTAPGYEIKPLAIGIAAGIIFDATVIRALLVPALMRLMGNANWWMPNWTRVALRLPDGDGVIRLPDAAVPSQRQAPASRPRVGVDD